MFVDGTFYIAPIFGYQVFITRIYAPEINTTYELLFEELKKNACKYNNNIIVTPKICSHYIIYTHCTNIYADYT
ncbi:hypothetical protein H8356DRAFT_1401472 [Neocallimastix lanati (nom. inval.)]|nr:hypothetical protein H8356DRAFT_1401472 [Neocallimastix sp. JGI-2020a]